MCQMSPRPPIPTSNPQNYQQNRPMSRKNSMDRAGSSNNLKKEI